MLNQFSRTELLIGKEGIEKLNNLSEVIYVSMASEDVINEIEAMGIEVK